MLQHRSFQVLHLIHDAANLILVIRMPTDLHALFQFVQSFQKPQYIFLLHTAKDCHIWRSVFSKLAIEPYSHLMTNKELVCKIRFRIEKNKVVKSQRELFYCPIKLISQDCSGRAKITILRRAKIANFSRTKIATPQTVFNN